MPSSELSAFGAHDPGSRLVACQSTCRSWASVLITSRAVQDIFGSWRVAGQAHLKKQIAAQARSENKLRSDQVHSELHGRGRSNIHFLNASAAENATVAAEPGPAAY